VWGTDATVAATSIATHVPGLYKQTGYALAPVNKTRHRDGCVTEEPGIPQGASRTSGVAAWQFGPGPTSKQVRDPGRRDKYGWSSGPAGTRTSLYTTQYQKEENMELEKRRHKKDVNIRPKS